MPLMKWTPYHEGARRYILKYAFLPPGDPGLKDDQEPYTDNVNKSDVMFLLAYPGETYTLMEKVEGIDTKEVLGHKADPAHVPAAFRDEAPPMEKPSAVATPPVTHVKKSDG